MPVDQRLADSAIAFINRRFPGRFDEGAAAMYTQDGEILVSTAIAVVNESVSLCHETGAICEAYARDKKIVATICVHKDQDGKFLILSPCGVCQERLWYWGGDIEVGAPLSSDDTKWESVKLSQMAPHYWRNIFMQPR
jgi:cytidine deaminase